MSNIQPEIKTGHYAVLVLEDEPFSIENLQRILSMLFSFEDLDLRAPLTVWTQEEDNKVMFLTGEAYDMEGWTRRL